MKFRYLITDKEYKGMELLKRIEMPKMCRRCIIKEAQNGSSRCKECSDEYKER